LLEGSQTFPRARDHRRIEIDGNGPCASFCGGNSHSAGSSRNVEQGKPIYRCEFVEKLKSVGLCCPLAHPFIESNRIGGCLSVLVHVTYAFMVAAFRAAALRAQNFRENEAYIWQCDMVDG
jgi:hypothetical protein